MLTLPLEPTDDRAHPLFKNAEECTRWLGQLQLTNLQLAHSVLLTQIAELNRYPMRGLERLETLERLRETVGFVQDDYAKKLIAKPLPLSDSEFMVFVAIAQLWQAMVLGYQRCLQAYIAEDLQLAHHGAILCQRCLHYSGLEIFEHLRMGYEFDGKLWHQLHELYGFAEQRDLHNITVLDPLNAEQAQSTSSSVYVKTLLACYAHPGELTRSQLGLLNRWLDQWTLNVTIDRQYTLSKGDAQPLCVDLSSTQGLQPILTMEHNAHSRYLAMVPLSKLLRVKTILLQQGQLPNQIGLSTFTSREDCIEFLTFLHQCWCEDHNTRFSKRRPVAEHAQLCYKLEGIYAHMTGHPFKQPKQQVGVDSLARHQIETFGRALKTAKSQNMQELGYPLETWHFENESILGARLIREDTLGGRLSYNQLVGLRPNDAATFMLGVTAWVHVARTGQLQLGLRYFPGHTDAVSMKATGVNLTVSDKYVPAFLLQAVPALKIPSSLIIPRDWFVANRAVEILQGNGEKFIAKMGFSVEHGLDYERVSYST